MIAKMKALYILRPKACEPKDDPWDPWFDKCFGFVIVAESEDEARQLADKEAGDENRGSFLRAKTADTNHPWLDSKYTSCELLTADSVDSPTVIMKDFASA
jgi:hypothetical protein